MPSIRSLGTQLAADRVITADEARTLVAKAKENGIVSNAEKADLKKIMTQYRDLFQPGALDVLKALVEVTPPPPPPTASPTINLTPQAGLRPVFVAGNGVFTVSPDGKPPANDIELGDAVFRAAEAADDAREPMLANLTPELQQKVFDQLKVTLARVPSDAAAQGFDPNQALQLRSSAATLLLDLANSAKSPELQKAALTTYQNLARAETNPRLRENLIFHFANAKVAQSGETKAVADALMKELTPTAPPYDKWFANGNNTVNLSWTVGQGEFWGGFTNYLKQNGFKPVGAENENGVTTYEATINKPGVGETKFRISVRQGGTGILAPMNDPNVQIVGYDGHSNWGRNMSASVKNGPLAPDDGDGKLVFYNLCVGKGQLDNVKAKYGNAQVVTTYAASNFYTDANGQMTRGEGVQALMALVDGVAGRKGWTDIHRTMNQAADIGWGRTWDNYITPISTLTREKVLDQDNDGQADYLDKHFNFSTFKVPEDSARELTPVRQDRHASQLDGTKLHMAVGMVNTLSEFSGILDKVNPDSRVLAGGWFEPKLGESDIVRFTEQKGRDGKPEIVMQFSARYAHMSEDGLRALAVSEFTRYLQTTNKLRMSAPDAKLAGALAFAQSLAVDEGWRDRDLWSAYLKRMNLPASFDLSMATQALAAHTGHNYAGDQATVDKLKELLGPAVVAELAKPEVGVPTQVL